VIAFLRAVWLVRVGLGLALMLAAGASARAEAPADDPASAFTATSPRFFKICTAQTYALCAVASCFVFNGLSYCKCDVKSGNSISLPFNFDDGEDVCSVNSQGENNGYMVSTFSLPESVLAPSGDKALYDCPARSSNGAYAQCDGGFCFTSTEGQSFPGFAEPLKEGQVICSCPTVVANPATAATGYQIAGPYPCQPSFFRNCRGGAASTKTGSTTYVGAPTGSARLLTLLLYGDVPSLNECHSR
jgi:hypothetical protein